MLDVKLPCLNLSSWQSILLLIYTRFRCFLTSRCEKYNTHFVRYLYRKCNDMENELFCLHLSNPCFDFAPVQLMRTIHLEFPSLSDTTINANYDLICTEEEGEHSDQLFVSYTRNLVLPVGDYEFYITRRFKNGTRNSVWPPRGKTAKMIVKERDCHEKCKQDNFWNGADFFPRMPFDYFNVERWSPMTSLYNTIRLKRDAVILNNAFDHLWETSVVRRDIIGLLKVNVKKKRGGWIECIPKCCLSSIASYENLRSSIRKNFSKLLDIFCFHIKCTTSRNCVEHVVTVDAIKMLIHQMRYTTPEKECALVIVFDSLALNKDSKITLLLWVDVVLSFIFVSVYGAKTNTDWEENGAPTLASVVDSFLHHFFFPVCYAHNPDDFIHGILMDRNTETAILSEVCYIFYSLRLIC
jgi:hypothetical protein